LFNSLNTLSEIVYEDARKADQYIQKLSGIYRYILQNEEIDLVPLNEEIEFVKQYFDIQKVRDNDKIMLEIDFQHASEFKIVPVSLQILVENALKHNSKSETLPLKIRIEMGYDTILVSNNIQRKNILENTSKTGLVNLRERVKLILDKDLIIEEENNQFIVKLPIVKL
jgi:LytS/YehU family sensor histidine kinase